MATFVVDGGLAIVTNRLKGAGTARVDLTAGNTDHTAGTSTQQTTTTTSDTYQVVATRTATGAGTVTNAGLWDAASGGNLFLKGDFTGIGLASADSIQFTIKAIFDN
jgi:hypothetical protein